MENIQEKFEHNIQEVEEQLARLTSLFEDMAIHPRGPSPLPNQRVPRCKTLEFMKLDMVSKIEV